VAWRPYDGHSGTRHARNFTFPNVDKHKLDRLSQKMHADRNAEFKRALKDVAPRRNAGLGSRKESAVVRYCCFCYSSSTSTSFLIRV
jgi:hypothetical protein